MSDLYEELLNDFREKQASAEESKEILSDLSVEELEALAYEIGAVSKEDLEKFKEILPVYTKAEEEAPQEETPQEECAVETTANENEEPMSSVEKLASILLEASMMNNEEEYSMDLNKLASSVAEDILANAEIDAEAYEILDQIVKEALVEDFVERIANIDGVALLKNAGFDSVLEDPDELAAYKAAKKDVYVPSKAELAALREAEAKRKAQEEAKLLNRIKAGLKNPKVKAGLTYGGIGAAGLGAGLGAYHLMQDKSAAEEVEEFLKLAFKDSVYMTDEELAALEAARAKEESKLINKIKRTTNAGAAKVKGAGNALKGKTKAVWANPYGKAAVIGTGALGAGLGAGLGARALYNHLVDDEVVASEYEYELLKEAIEWEKIKDALVNFFKKLDPHNGYTKAMQAFEEIKTLKATGGWGAVMNKYPFLSAVIIGGTGAAVGAGVMGMVGGHQDVSGNTAMAPSAAQAGFSHSNPINSNAAADVDFEDQLATQAYEKLKEMVKQALLG